MRMCVDRGTYYNRMWEKAHKGTGSFSDRGELLMGGAGWMMWSIWGRWWFGVSYCPFSGMDVTGVDGSTNCWVDS